MGKRYVLDLVTRKLVPVGQENKPKKIANWNYASEALGVQPDQIEEAKEHYRQLGEKVDFDRDGNLQVTGYQQWKRILRKDGFVDLNGEKARRR